MDVPSVGSESYYASPFPHMHSHEPHLSQPRPQPGPRLQPRIRPQSQPPFLHPPSPPIPVTTNVQAQAPLPRPLHYRAPSGTFAQVAGASQRTAADGPEDRAHCASNHGNDQLSVHDDDGSGEEDLMGPNLSQVHYQARRHDGVALRLASQPPANQQHRCMKPATLPSTATTEHNGPAAYEHGLIGDRVLFKTCIGHNQIGSQHQPEIAHAGGAGGTQGSAQQVYEAPVESFVPRWEVRTHRKHTSGGGRGAGGGYGEEHTDGAGGTRPPPFNPATTRAGALDGGCL